MLSDQRARGGKLNRLKAVWRSGGCTLGAIATMPSTQVIQVMARSGLDWVLIDLEHGAIDLAALHAMIAATAGTPLVPLVRVTAGARWHAKAPLDFGALGVDFPMTTRAVDAQAIVRAVRYPPEGERMWGPFYAPLHWNLSMQEYLDCANDEVLAIGTVEHVDALATICEVVTTKGLDLLFIGPGDLATSMGVKGHPEDPRVVDAIGRFEAVIRPSPVILGGVARTPEHANAMIARGYRALVVGFDWSLLQRGIAAAIAGVDRKATS